MLFTHSKPPCFALVDCNNFFASCERIFNPKLSGRPVIVLSNNDGCVIARSNEAKMLGIKMGEPFFKITALCDRYRVHVFSSNFALYGDISKRVMRTLNDLCPDMEIYSIDEAFLRLDRLVVEPTEYAHKIRQTVWQYVGIPVSIGLAPTKTLAKVANHVAKQDKKRGVCVLHDKNAIKEALENFPIEALWGVGRKWSDQLHRLNIYTAAQLLDKPDHYLKKHFSVMMTRLVNELRGISCLPLEEVQAKQNIICSRSFGQPITEQSDLSEAISTFAARAGEKARVQRTKAHGVTVFIRTSPFHSKKPFYSNHASQMFVMPTHDTTKIVKTANQLLKRLYQPNFDYKKAGVMLLNLTLDTVAQADLFQPDHYDNDGLMLLLDNINNRYGQQSLFLAAEGTRKNWTMKQTRRSRRYTTCWDELPVVV